MPELESLSANNANDQVKTSTGDVKIITLGNTTFEVVSNYTGKNSLLDIVKNAIKRDVESKGLM